MRLFAVHDLYVFLLETREGTASGRTYLAIFIVVLVLWRLFKLEMGKVGVS